MPPRLCGFCNTSRPSGSDLPRSAPMCPVIRDQGPQGHEPGNRQSHDDQGRQDGALQGIQGSAGLCLNKVHAALRHADERCGIAKRR
jgi:hypothetical protein